MRPSDIRLWDAKFGLAHVSVCDGCLRRDRVHTSRLGPRRIGVRRIGLCRLVLRLPDAQGSFCRLDRVLPCIISVISVALGKHAVAACKHACEQKAWGEPCAGVLMERSGLV